MVLPDPYTPMDGENKAITTKKKKKKKKIFNICDYFLLNETLLVLPARHGRHIGIMTLSASSFHSKFTEGSSISLGSSLIIFSSFLFFRSLVKNDNINQNQ